jgi:hypothetical protein
MAKSEYIQIRVSTEIKKKLQTAADAENRTLSNYLINAGLEKIKEDKKMEKRIFSVIEQDGKTYNVYEEPYMFSDDEYRAEAEDEEGNKYTAHWAILDSWKALPDDADAGQEEACDWDNGWITK